MHTWRDSAKRAIAEVVKDNTGKLLDEKQFRKLLTDAYPFGERAYHPYKIWLSQVKHTMKVLYPNNKKEAVIKAEGKQTQLF